MTPAGWQTVPDTWSSWQLLPMAQTLPVYQADRLEWDKQHTGVVLAIFHNDSAVTLYIQALQIKRRMFSMSGRVEGVRHRQALRDMELVAMFQQNRHY